MDNKTTCGGCGVSLTYIDGPTHSYMLSSPACWKLYGEVLAREYSDEAYWKIHRLTVDTYAIQHPGDDDRRAIQSVSVHLASLFLIFEKNFTYEQATNKLGFLIEKQKDNFQYLKRPKHVGNLTILDIWETKDAKQHVMSVENWAKSAFSAWSEHREYINNLLMQLF